MELQLIEETRHTRIKCPLKQYPEFKKFIASCIALYGGREEKRNTRFIYFIIDADLLNGKREQK